MISAPARMASSVARAEVAKSQRVGAHDVDDLAALGVELFQVGGFVLLALAAEEVGVVFGDVGALAGAAGDFEGQRGEVGALDVVVEVGGGEDEAVARQLASLRIDYMQPEPMPSSCKHPLGRFITFGRHMARNRTQSLT